MKKSIQVKQRDKSDCGAACLASVAAYFGLHIPVSRIRSYAGTGRQGTSLRGLIEAAEQLHIKARGVKMNGFDLSNVPVPAIFHLVLENGLQHFVVVYKIKKTMIRYMDPAGGKLVTRRIQDFEKARSGVILLLAPAASFRKAKEKDSVFYRFWLLILPHRNLLILALAGAVIYTLLGLSISIYVQKIFDNVLPFANTSLIKMMSVVMISLLIFRTVIGYLKSLIVLQSGLKIDRRLILGYYKHLLNLPQRFFDGMRVGEILSRVNDAVNIRIFINDVVLNVVVNLLSVVLSITVMCLYYWKLALAILCSVPVYLLVYRISNRLNAKWQRKIMERSASLEGHLVESVKGVSTIRRFGINEWFNLKTENRFNHLMQAVFTGKRNSFLLGHFTECLTGLITVAILWSGSRLVIDHILTAGELMSFYTLLAFFAVPVQVLIGVNRSMQDALIAADRLFEIIDLETEQSALGIVGDLPEGDLIFNEVDFGYSPGCLVFEKLRLRFPQFRITGVMGDNGSGKSTLLSLIHKFYTPNGGNIMIGKFDLCEIPIETLRKKIAAVPQQIDLFQGNFISNIALGDPNPDMERIFDLCRRLGLDETITRLPNGYQTIVLEQGMNLSGGQRQKIGIARAFYREPAILLLDEASSALDADSEQKLHETLRWFAASNKTVIMIAHRRSSLRCCDGIIHIKQGKGAVYGEILQGLEESRNYSDWWANYE